jgi:hypothetical protein
MYFGGYFVQDVKDKNLISRKTEHSIIKINKSLNIEKSSYRT